MKVGFIGLGRMGVGMAGRVTNGGHDLIVYTRTPEKASELAQAGARVAESVTGACEDREVVITMVADDAALEAVALGKGGVRDSISDGAIHMVMGTHGVAAIEKLTGAHAESNQFLVAAPVLGRPDMAASGQLVIVAAGSTEAVQQCGPLLESIGKRTFETGSVPKAAMAIKLANNFVLGSAIEAMGEAFALTRKCSVEPQALFDVLTEGFFSASAHKIYGKIIAEEAYDQAGFTANLSLKDTSLILAAGDLTRVPLPSVNTYRDRLLGAIAQGDGEKDWAVMAREQWRASGME
jgi:3-hydroxyisobutyrate dehydrogenase-like beta-hydroxyacid dehydrogenase